MATSWELTYYIYKIRGIKINFLLLQQTMAKWTSLYYNTFSDNLDACHKHQSSQVPWEFILFKMTNVKFLLFQKRDHEQQKLLPRIHTLPFILFWWKYKLAVSSSLAKTTFLHWRFILKRFFSYVQQYKSTSILFLVWTNKGGDASIQLLYLPYCGYQQSEGALTISFRCQ